MGLIGFVPNNPTTMKKIKAKFVLSAPTDLTLPTGEVVQAFDVFFHEDHLQSRDEACVCCGRKMKPDARGLFLQVTTSGFFIPGSVKLEPSQGSQGFFEIGSDCAKKFPKGFAIKFDELT